jgi:DNA-binding response OmpR family regulator
MNVLIVEDEIPLANEIRDYLVKEGFFCDEAHTGKIASDKLFSNDYDLLLLDLGLPDYDGIDLLKESIANHSNIAVIILSARSALEDRIKGLNVGADDYLPKPFSLLELKSRIMAVMRRKHGIRANVVHINKLEIDLDKRLVSVGGNILTLTRKEYDILSFLILNKNRVVTRLHIIEENYNSNYIDVHIKNLRKKLSEFIEGDFLETVRGIGFQFIEINPG